MGEKGKNFARKLLKPSSIIGIIIVAIIVILGIWLISAYNNFVKMKNKIEEAFATMDVYLKKRWDLIPNLVNTVKGYAEHEKSTFEKIAALREQFGK